MQRVDDPCGGHNLQRSVERRSAVSDDEFDLKYSLVMIEINAGDLQAHDVSHVKIVWRCKTEIFKDTTPLAAFCTSLACTE
jgi:hypothetical protein